MNRNHEDHEDHEDHRAPEVHDGSSSRLPGVRVFSPLSPEAELVMSQTIGSAIAVHRVLGPGFVEKIYRRAMCIELEARNLAYEKERSIRVKPGLQGVLDPRAS
jgi:PD-(D/E)XK nuclease superfamily protein